MPYFSILFALLSLALPKAPHAAGFKCEKEWAKIQRIYSKSYDCDYVGGNCYENALKLARALLAEPGIDPKNLQVAYIFPRPKNARSIYARGGRKGSEEWRYHVLVIYKGHVMDHDHGKAASIKKVSEYIEDMFEKPIPESAMVEGQHLFEPRSDALLRLIPAKDYVENTARTTSGRLDYQHYISDPAGTYPAMRIKEFLERFDTE